MVDMCEGQYANQYRNAASKVKLPPQIWFMDFVLQLKCVSLGTQDAKTGLFPQCLVFIPQGLLVLHS